MAGSSGRAESALGLFFADAAERPWAHDFFFLVRALQAHHSTKPRIGSAQQISDEVVRFSQIPSLRFEGGAIGHFGVNDAGIVEIASYFFGLVGPLGPMPAHITEVALETDNGARSLLSNFFDLFHQRLFALLYRAWEVSDLCASADRPDNQAFAMYLGSLFGQGAKETWGRDALSDGTKRYFSGWLGQQAKSPEGLSALASEIVGVECDVEPYVGEWISIPATQQLRLGSAGGLGRDTVLGARQWTKQSRIRIQTWPLSLAAYRELLPGGGRTAGLRAAVRNYAGDELRVSLRPVLAKDQVPRLNLDGATRLGWDTWMPPAHSRAADASDYEVDLSVALAA